MSFDPSSLNAVAQSIVPGAIVSVGFDNDSLSVGLDGVGTVHIEQRSSGTWSVKLSTVGTTLVGTKIQAFTTGIAQLSTFAALANGAIMASTK